MDKMDLISIIVPVYNVEKYLKECVNSLIKQTYKNIEIILVDDGSTDESGKICDEFSKIDNRIKTLHKINGGASDARNFGIERSLGKYVMFVDSDDLVDEVLVEQLYSAILSEKGIKLAICNLVHFKEDENPIYFRDKKVITLTKKEGVIDFLYQKKVSTSACANLYLKELLDTVRFVKGQRFEDNEFIFEVLLLCEKISYVEAKLYAYRHRLNSTTTTMFDEKEFDIIEIGKEIMRKTTMADSEIRTAAIVYQCTNCFRIFLTITDEYIHDKRYEYCKNFLRTNAKSVIKNTYAIKKLRIGLLLFYIKIPRKVLNTLRKKRNRWS